MRKSSYRRAWIQESESLGSKSGMAQIRCLLTRFSMSPKDVMDLTPRVTTPNMMLLLNRSRRQRILRRGKPKTTHNLGSQKQRIKFVGLALQDRSVEWMATFLNESKHAAGIPRDYASFHFYASCADRNDPNTYEQFFSYTEFQ